MGDSKKAYEGYTTIRISKTVLRKLKLASVLKHDCTMREFAEKVLEKEADKIISKHRIGRQ